MRNLKLLDINLRLFDGAAGAAAAGGEGSGDGSAQVGTGTLPKAETGNRRGSSRRGRTGDLSNIVFGSQDEASPAGENTGSDAGSKKGAGNAKADVSVTSDTLEARRAEFERLIDSDEYRDVYAEKFQETFNRRFKGHKEMEGTLAAQKPIIDMLSQRYNVTDGDMAKLLSALEQDDAYWEEAAEKAGLTIEQYKLQQKIERENAELRAYRDKMAGQEYVQQQMNNWYREAEKVKALYPSFNFETEIKNRNFQQLLKAKIPMQQAYELMHMEEIKNATAKTAAETAGQQMIANMKNNAARPLENGTSSQSAAIVKNDVHNLTKEERAEAARRALHGEKITFRGNR